MNENKYLLTSLTKACKYMNNTVRMRLPIHKSLLHMLLGRLETTFMDKGQPYLKILYQAMFAASYYRLLRVGEVALGMHTILAKDVHISDIGRMLNRKWLE